MRQEGFSFRRKPVSEQISGFTLIELLIVITILAVLGTITLIAINPLTYQTKAQHAKARVELEEIAKAAKLYGEANGSYPADVNRNIPSVFQPYFSYTSGTWPTGAFPGSVFDWDNWENQTCWDGSTGIIQITLRQISNINVIPGAEWTMFYVIKGKGVPHCSTSTTQGECINCNVIYGARKPI